MQLIWRGRITESNSSSNKIDSKTLGPETKIIILTGSYVFCFIIQGNKENVKLKEARVHV